MAGGETETAGVAEVASEIPTVDEAAASAKDAARQKAALAVLGSFRPIAHAVLTTPASARFGSDDTLLRYLRARDADEEKALALLKGTIAWREKHIDPLMSVSEEGSLLQCPSCCVQCKVDPRSHCFFSVGKDTHGRPVVYSCAGRAANKVVEDNMVHMAVELERLFDGNSAPGKYVWVIDFNGFGMRDCNPRMATTAIPMFADQYPERMGQIVLINPPAAFQILWRAVKPILDPVTKEKIVLLRGQKAIAQYSETHWRHDPAMAAWLDAAVFTTRGSPGSFPAASFSNALTDENARVLLERCRLLAK